MAGTYTDIVEIVAPSSAEAGELVTVEARVRNLYTVPIYIAVTGSYNGVDIPFSPEYASVGPGATYSFSRSFPMPNHDIRLHVGSYFWSEPEWYVDDYAYVDIALAEVVEPYKGTISRKELEYDESRSRIPVY